MYNYKERKDHIKESSEHGEMLWGVGGKTVGAAEGMEPWSQRKARESRTHGEMHKNTNPKLLVGKIRGADSREFCKQQDSKTGVLEFHGLGWNRET